jgi:4-hydroxybenzoate polyprenyltransferase
MFSGQDPEPSARSATSSASEVASLDKAASRSLMLLVVSVGRLPVGIITALAVQLIVGFYSDLPLWLTIFHGLPICLTTMAGFVMNDIIDVEKDRNRVSKLLVSGRVKMQDAYVFSAALSFAALATALLISTNSSFWIIFSALFGVTIYSDLARLVPVLKGALTAVLCCAPFAYAAEVANLVFPLKFYALIVVFIFGRELLLDVRDFSDDQSMGMRTLVAYLMPRPSRFIGWTLMAGSMVVVSFTVEGLGRLLFCCGILSLIFCAWMYRRNEDVGLAWSRLTLLFGVIGAGFSLQY